MAGVLFATQIDNLQLLVKTKHCPAIKYIYRASDYADLANLLFYYNETFACDPTYLDAIFAIFTDDTVLIAQGIYYNKNISDTNNPKFVAKCNISNEILMDAGGNMDSLYIHENCVIEKIRIANNTTLDYLIVAGSSVVRDIVVEDGSKLNYLRVRSCFDTGIASFPSNVHISDGRDILEVSAEELAILTIDCVTTLF